MKETSDSTSTTAPKIPRFERKKTLDKEHKDALDRAVSLNVPHAVDPMEEENSRHEGETEEPSSSQSGDSSTKMKPTSGRTNWDDVVGKLFHQNESGDLHLRKEVATVEDNAPQSQ